MKDLIEAQRSSLYRSFSRKLPSKLREEASMEEENERDRERERERVAWE